MILISIPKWSDFSAVLIKITVLLLTFQSQNGLILVYVYKCYIVVFHQFQSQNGLILVKFVRWTYNTLIRFQSQNGLILVV